MLSKETGRVAVHLVDALVGPVRADHRLQRLVHDPFGGVQLRGPLRQPLHAQNRMVSDEPPHVLRLVTWGVVDEEDDPLHPVLLCVLEEVGEVELEFSAPTFRIGVEDEPVPPSLRPEERDENVPPSVVARRDNSPLGSSLHPFCLDLQIERHPGLVLKCDYDPFFARAALSACSSSLPSPSLRRMGRSSPRQASASCTRGQGHGVSRGLAWG